MDIADVEYTVTLLCNMKEIFFRTLKLLKGIFEGKSEWNGLTRVAFFFILSVTVI